MNLKPKKFTKNLLDNWIKKVNKMKQKHKMNAKKLKFNLTPKQFAFL